MSSISGGGFDTVVKFSYTTTINLFPSTSAKFSDIWTPDLENAWIVNEGYSSASGNTKYDFIYFYLKPASEYTRTIDYSSYSITIPELTTITGFDSLTVTSTTPTYNVLPEGIAKYQFNLYDTNGSSFTYSASTDCMLQICDSGWYYGNSLTGDIFISSRCYTPYDTSYTSSDLIDDSSSDTCHSIAVDGNKILLNGSASVHCAQLKLRYATGWSTILTDPDLSTFTLTSVSDSMTCTFKNPTVTVTGYALGYS